MSDKTKAVYKLHEFLSAHRNREIASFHMPGHKGDAIFREFGYGDILDGLVAMDITEVSGADNLFAASGVIADVQRGFAELYGAEASYLSVNGSSGAIIASVLAAVCPGEFVIAARISHKSVFNGITLSGAEVFLAEPRKSEWGICAEIRPETIRQIFEKHYGKGAEKKGASAGKIAAVIIPSPNYYGVCSDVAAIAGIAHEYGAILIVDQAHGAHIPMFERFCPDFARNNMPASGEAGGADIVINSTHKTLAAFTQSAVCNLMNAERVPAEDLEYGLQLMQSTSPSYMLMAGLDMCRDMLHKNGKLLMRRWADNLKYFYEIYEKTKRDEFAIITGDNQSLLDITKVNILSDSRRGLCNVLENDFGIFPEFYSGNIVMCMTGIGNTRDDYKNLLAALEHMRSAGKLKFTRAARDVSAKMESGRGDGDIRHSALRIPKGEKFSLKLDEAVGMISASLIIPYPPGIPILCPGELITKQKTAEIRGCMDEGKAVSGMKDDRLFVFAKGAGDHKSETINRDSFIV